MVIAAVQTNRCLTSCMLPARPQIKVFSMPIQKTDLVHKR